MTKRLRPDSPPSDDPVSAPSRSREPSTDAPAHTPKYTELDNDSVDTDAPTDSPNPTIPQPSTPHAPKSLMECTLPPHAPLSFPSYSAYETHYASEHTNRCRACRANFPSAHYLELHQSENHDPLIAARRDRGERTYGCFVEGCARVCSGWEKRRRHLVDAHGFPRNYDFFVVNEGIDGRRSLLRPGVDERGHRASSRQGSRHGHGGDEGGGRTKGARMRAGVADGGREGGSEVVSSEAAGNGDDDDERGSGEGPSAMVGARTGGGAASGGGNAVDDLTMSMSALRFVPSSVTFGKRKPGAGFARS